MQANMMHIIYAEAECNISATASNQDIDRLFFQRDTGSFHIELDLCLDQADEGGRYARYNLVSGSHLHNELADGALSKRGWVLQERLLSPRVLHFGQKQLIWECNELAACEAWPDGMPLDITMPIKTLEVAAYTKTGNVSIDDLKPWLWQQLLLTYSRTHLTKPGDKLIAFSGIAKRIALQFHDEYICGLWRSELPKYLAWYVIHNDTIYKVEATRPAGYRAPSFSWASIDGCVWFPYSAESQIVITMDEITIDYFTNDKMGRVRAGYIVITGHLSTMTWAGLRWDKTNFSWMIDFIGGQYVGDESSPTVYFDIQEPLADRIHRLPNLFCLPILRGVEHDDKPQEYKCLILQSHGHGVYSRVGLILGLRMDLVPLSREDGTRHPCLKYDQLSNQHTIKII